MTKRELIEALAPFPDDMEVLMDIPCNDFYYAVDMARIESHSGDYKFVDEHEAYTEQAILLKNFE